MSEYRSIVNESVRDGPIPHRKCTDILCCLIFTCFLVTLFVIGIVGFTKGDPELIIYPYDSTGYQCGRPGRETHDYKYLYYPAANHEDHISNYTKYRVCVKHCPEEASDTIECFSNEQVRCGQKSNELFLKFGDDFTQVETYESISLWKRFCLPDPDLDYFNDVLDDVYVNGLEDWIADISRCWTAMFIMLGISVGFSIVYLILLRYCVGLILWTSILATIVIFIVFGIYIDKIADENYGSKDKKKTREALNIAAIIIYCAVGLFVLIILFLYRRIKLAIAIMKSGAIFLKDVPGVIFVPIVMFGLSFAFFTYWVLALIYIYSSGKLKHGNSVVAKVSWDESTRNSLYFEIIGVVWISSMKIALTQFIIACTVSIWYFTRDKASSSSILKSAYYSVRYHLGSLAFGAFLLSFIKIVKFILWYLKEKVYKEAVDSNKCVKCACRCVECYVNCFERFIKFLDKHAYIEIALTGESFCFAAKNAFALILENSLRFAALGAIGDIFKVVGKIFITCLSAWIGFLIITHFDPYKDEIQSPIAPTCVFALIAYCVSGLFMSIYEMVCDTIIHAFIYDEKLHIGPQFAPEPLKAFMSENKEKDHSSCCGCL